MFESIEDTLVRAVDHFRGPGTAQGLVSGVQVRLARCVRLAGALGSALAEPGTMGNASAADLATQLGKARDRVVTLETQVKQLTSAVGYARRAAVDASHSAQSSGPNLTEVCRQAVLAGLR